MDTYHVIGLMSGSSLDGLDIAYCQFDFTAEAVSFKIQAADVAPYTDEWVQEIKRLPVANAKTLWEVHTAMGAYFGERVATFIHKHKLENKVDYVASHGHTIFHFPEKRFTTQIADGAALSAKANLPVICDFRSMDIAYGGQGTPIVPIGDLLLFKDYRFCLNIGGIANVSCKTDDVKGERPIVAFDICAANQVMNVFAARLGKEYDEDGKFAASGKVNEELLGVLNRLDYYTKAYPKSLDNSFSREAVLPLIEKFEISPEDKLCTYAEHIAVQLAAHVNTIAQTEKLTLSPDEKMLVTGGGAFNNYLIERIRHHTKLAVVVPAADVVKFKEALVIAFMGVLRMRNQINVLKSVTGASQNSVSGAVYRP